MAVKTTEPKSLLENVIQSKRVKVSTKRQISIPKNFYDEIGLGEEVLIELHNNRLVIRPIRPDTDDFSSEILADLVHQGYEGDELLQKFEERKAMIGPAVNNLVEEARGSKSYDSFEDMLEDTEDESDDK